MVMNEFHVRQERNRQEKSKRIQKQNVMILLDQIFHSIVDSLHFMRFI